MTFTDAEVRTYFASRAPKLHESGGELRGPCPVHGGAGPNFSVSLETGLACCHSQCGKGWDLIGVEQELSGFDFIRAKERVFELIGRPLVPWDERNLQAVYDYTDEAGTLLYQVLRYFGKEFKQRRPAGSIGWTWGIGEVRRVPYNLVEVTAAQFIAIVEGEKDCLTLRGLGITGSCNSGGAGNFRPELVPSFAGKDIAIIPDNDDPGRAHAMQVAALLAPVAKSVKILELPEMPLKGDVTDYVIAGGTRDTLRALYKAAQVWTPEWQFAVLLPDADAQYFGTLAEDINAKGGETQYFMLGNAIGLATPWKKLSRELGGGMLSGEVYILGAEQGVGKTSLAIQFVISAIQKHQGVLMFSMEMSDEMVFKRMTAIEARVNLNEFTYAQLVAYGRVPADNEEQIIQARLRSDEMMSALVCHAKQLKHLPLIVCTKPSVTPEYIIEATARCRARQRIDLVVVDHMQLMASSGKEKSDYEKFTSISRAMKHVAVVTNVPVLLVSQTSRKQAFEHRDPQVSDLRGSGAIEEDAAAVMLLFEDRADADLARKEGDGSRYTKGPVRSYVKLGKNRYGEQGWVFPLLHHKTTTHFEET